MSILAAAAGTAASADLPAIGQPILTLRGVSKFYGEVKAARDVNLEIPRGSIYGFLGPNGAGKTTTIRSIMNIILPDEGEVLFAGRELDADLRDRIGYKRRADDWLQRLGLAEWRDRKVDALSKGMQQKIQFAATFIAQPDLVILDEVFSGLDPLNIELLRDMILEEKEKGTTIIFSTHMLAEAEKICDFICLIEGGQVIIDGSLDEVRANFPLKSVRVAYGDGSEPPADLPGILHRDKHEGSWRLMLDEGAAPADLLERLAVAGPLTLYSANRPTLSEIFLEAVERNRKEVRS
jgi:ABC-2 type transport system ATP-binding protein